MQPHSVVSGIYKTIIILDYVQVYFYCQMKCELSCFQI